MQRRVLSAAVVAPSPAPARPLLPTPARPAPLRIPFRTLMGDCDGTQASADPSGRMITVAFIGSMHAWATKGASQVASIRVAGLAAMAASTSPMSTFS